MSAKLKCMHCLLLLILLSRTHLLLLVVLIFFLLILLFKISYYSPLSKKKTNKQKGKGLHYLRRVNSLLNHENTNMFNRAYKYEQQISKPYVT